jgi:hypothetical protein
VYAWYFRDFLPASVTADCIRFGELRLLYVGISPSAPPTNGKAPSKQSLWHRIRYHYRGNAEGSTLRLSLGCLLLPTLELSFALSAPAIGSPSLMAKKGYVGGCRTMHSSPGWNAMNLGHWSTT